MKDDKDSNLKELKLKYAEFSANLDIPKFSDLNELFDIEDTDSDSDFLLRKIRRSILERVSSYLRFVELLLNPGNAPMFFFNLIKKLDSGDKDFLGELYEKLGLLELEVLELDLGYNEKKECEFINKVYKLVNEEIKIKFLELSKKLMSKEKEYPKETKSYFG